MAKGVSGSEQLVLVQGSNIASAATITPGPGDYFHITGTTTITAIASAAKGAFYIFAFDGALTLTYDATALILQGSANMTTAAGDVVGFVSEGGGNYREVFRRLAAAAVVTPVSVANGGTGLTAQPDVDAWISAASMKGTTTTGAGDANQLPTSAETTTNKVNYDYIAFTASQQAFWQWRLPAGWDEGTITFRYSWTATGGSGDVTMGLKAVSLGDNEALDTAFGSQVTVTDTLQTASRVHESAKSAAITIGNTPAERDIIFFNLTLTALAPTGFRLLGVTLSHTRASYTD